MTGYYLSDLVMGPLLGWMAAVSVSLVAYLISLQLKEFKRNRRLDAQRRRLGLRHA